MTKQQFFDLIEGEEVHDLCRYIIDLKHQPSFSYFPSEGGSFSVYNGVAWHLFTLDNDGIISENSEFPFDLSKSLKDQEDKFFEAMDGLTEWMR